MRPRIENSIGDDAMEEYGFLKFTDETLKTSFLQTLNTMRKNRLFCDVVLNVENADIHAHKNVLACISPHLMELFSAERDNQYRHSDGIPSYRLNSGLTKVALEYLVEYAYTAVLNVPDVLVKDVYLAAWRLRIDNIVNECARHLIAELCVDSCIETRSLPGINKNKTFVLEVDSFISKEFSAVSQTAGFLQLPCATIDVLYQTKQEMGLVTHSSLCGLVFDWMKRQLTEETLTMNHLLERSHLLYLALDNSLQDCSDLPQGHESETDLVQDYKRLVLKCPNNKGRRKNLATPMRPRVIIYSRNIGDREDKTGIEPDWNVIGSTIVGENTFIGLCTLNGILTRISIQLRLNLPNPVTPAPTIVAGILNNEPSLLTTQQPLSAQSTVQTTNTDVINDREEQQPDLYREVAAMTGPKCGLGVAEWYGKLLVCGGYNRGECLKTVESYCPISNKWMKEANMSEARGRVQIAVLNDIVYAVGGSNGTTELDTVECLQKNAKKWQKKCKLPLARSNAGVCALNDKIYCIGGWNAQIGIKQCEMYEPEIDKWTSISPLIIGRYQAGVATFKNKLWVAGGSDAWTCLSSVETYNPETDQWSMASSMLTPRRGCGLAEFNGKLYVVGGTDGTHSLSSTEIYDTDSKTWTIGPNLTTARSNVSVISVENRLYAVGGFAGKCFLNTIEYLDVATNEWTTFAPHTEPSDDVATGGDSTVTIPSSAATGSSNASIENLNDENVFKSVNINNYTNNITTNAGAIYNSHINGIQLNGATIITTTSGTTTTTITTITNNNNNNNNKYSNGIYNNFIDHHHNSDNNSSNSSINGDDIADKQLLYCNGDTNTSLDHKHQNGNCITIASTDDGNAVITNGLLIDKISEKLATIMEQKEISKNMDVVINDKSSSVNVNDELL